MFDFAIAVFNKTPSQPISIAIETSDAGELFGKIIDSPKGKGGFGYDPIFQVKNSSLTLAEVSRSERMRISHRTMSTLKMITLLKESKIY